MEIKLKNRVHTNFVRPENDGKKVCLAGFVKTIRVLGKNLVFIILQDIQGEVQLTFTKENFSAKELKKLSSLHLQTVLSIEGHIHKTKLTKRGVEVLVNKYEILSESYPNLPLDLVQLTSKLDKRLDYRWLDLRIKKHQLVFKILSDFVKFSRDYFYKNDFIEIFTPKLMGAPSEGGAEVFVLPYFGKTAYLAQSPQFYKQMAISAGFEKVFEIAPVFRANPSFTTRHDTEFTSLDAEIGYIDSYEDLFVFEENWLIFVLKKLKEKWEKEIRKEFETKIVIPSKPFPRIPMSKVYEILKKQGLKVAKDEDIGTPGERTLGKFVLKNYGHEFVFVTEFPWAIRPFYHMRPKDNKKITYSYDLLWKGLEITTGAQREHRYKFLIEQAKEKGLNLKNISFYLNFFKYGCPPHGGFGLSPTRFVMSLLNLKNVREATFLPRDPTRLFP